MVKLTCERVKMLCGIKLLRKDGKNSVREKVRGAHVSVHLPLCTPLGGGQS